METDDDLQATFSIIALLAELYRFVNDSTSAHMLANLPNDGNFQHILKLEGLVNVYFDTDIDASKVADMLYISKRQLARIVKQHYGCTLRRLIMDKRLQVAATMLTETNKSAEVIGESVGFGTKSSFYREFRETYGITPMEYRRLYGKHD